jgi:serine/threonine protein kinase
MGVVYEAEQQALGRRVALKVLPRTSAGDASALLRFQREAKAAARMHHTNIVPVFDVGQDGEHLYYAMQLIHGQGLDLVIEDLKRLRAQSGATPAVDDKTVDRSIAAALATGIFEKENLAPEAQTETNATAAYEGSAPSSAVLPGQSDISTATTNRGAYFRSVAQIGVQTASALSYAHSRGIIHRDIKPGNLILDTTGNVWVTDFGLAKTGDGGVTHTGDILGTVRYMAPERFRGQCDVRADVYALGMTLYELLTLKAAYASGDRLKLIELIRHTEPASPRSIDARMPRDLETIVMKAIDKDPKRRYQSADEIAEDLQRFVNDEPIKARRIGSVERVGRWCRRNPAVAGLTAAVLLLMAAGTGLSSWLAVRAAQARDAEVEQRQQAEKSEQKALAAAAAEKEAKETAEANEAETKAVLDFVQKKVFAAARPVGAEGGLGHDVTLRKAVEAALPFVDKSFTNQPLIEARLRNTLATSFLDLGEWKIAVEQAERARTLYMQQRGPDHADTLGSTVNLAHIYARVGRQGDGVALLELALPVMKAKMPDHEATIYCMTALAENLNGVGRYEEGLKLHQEALQLYKAKFGPDHRTTLGGIVNLALAYRHVGRLTEAIKLLEEVLPGMKTKMPDHEFTFICMDHLAHDYASAGRTQESITLFEEMLQLEKAKLGSDHAAALGGKVNLAIGYRSVGRLSDAIKLLEETLPVMKAKIPDHEFTFNCMTCLAGAYREARRPQEVIKLYEEMLQFQKGNLGPEHPKALGIMTELAIAYDGAGRHQEALELCEKRLQFQKAKLGTDNTSTLGGMVNLANSYLQLGRFRDAIELYEQALAIMSAKIPGHAFTLNCMTGLAHAYVEAGRSQDGLKLFEEALDVRKAKLGPDHRDTLALLDQLCGVYLAVAAQQAWFGQEQESAATCERALSVAQDTKFATVADRVAKLCSLRPSGDKTHEAALLLARRAVELGKGNRFMPYFLTGLGMAEYRSGHFTEADAALAAAIEAGKVNPHVAQTSAFYHAMSLFRQGKEDQAKQLAAQAAATMKPLPKDEKSPLAAGANADDLILWLAYKEARDLIKLDKTSGTGGQQK